MKFIPVLLSILIVCISNSSKVFAQDGSNRWQGISFPNFELMDQNKTLKKNSDYLNQWVVYFFYPKDRTPGCTEEAKNFVEDYQKFTVLNTALVGISYDDPDSHKDFADTYEMKFTLLADVDKKLTKSLKVDSFLPWPHPNRQSFLVNPDGIIVKHYPNVDPSVHSAELLADLERIKNEQ